MSVYEEELELITHENDVNVGEYVKLKQTNNNSCILGPYEVISKDDKSITIAEINNRDDSYIAIKQTIRTIDNGTTVDFKILNLSLYKVKPRQEQSGGISKKHHKRTRNKRYKKNTRHKKRNSVKRRG